MPKPWLYIPLETKVRELHGKTLLACFAAINGFEVVIGSKKDVNARIFFFPRGIIFNFGLAKNFSKNATRYKKYGHDVASIDEEGIVTLNDNLYLKHRVSRETLDVTDMFFCWGKHQADIIAEKCGKTNCEIFITGNPRFDMLRTQYKSVFNKDAEIIKNKYGKFILVNTNFGHGNHFAGDDFLIESLKEKGWMNDLENKQFFVKNIEWQKKMLNKFLEMIPKLSENFRNYKIIIRPHPSEKQELWKNLEKKFDNILVVYEGNVIPWLLAAEILIHNGCTTAIESYLLGVKTIAYRPFIVSDQETELPNKISVEVYNTNELIDAINRLMLEKFDPRTDNNKMVYLSSFLADFKSETFSEKIASILASKIISRKKTINDYIPVSFLEKIAYFRETVAKILLRNSNNLISNSYHLHKVPGLDKNEIRKIIDSFSKIDNRISGIQVEKIRNTCHRIYSESI